jgi:hypothetical protein
MRLYQPRPAGRQLAACAAVIAAVIAAGCGGSGQTGPSASPRTGSPATEPSAGSAAKVAVTALWAEFFSVRTATRRRAELLQNGQTMVPALAAQAKLPAASTATARVSRVTLVSPAEATVTYSILTNGSPVLTNQRGIAVYASGQWRVALTSFCRLLALENGGGTSSLPLACRRGG